jgi:hypothetical protein
VHIAQNTRFDHISARRGDIFALDRRPAATGARDSV